MREAASQRNRHRRSQVFRQTRWCFGKSLCLQLKKNWHMGAVVPENGSDGDGQRKGQSSRRRERGMGKEGVGQPYL
jgi:hypothetical protein